MENEEDGVQIINEDNNNSELIIQNLLENYDKHQTDQTGY